jgi:protease-4
MIPQPPPGQGPVDPRGAFSPPPAPEGGAGFNPPQSSQQGPRPVGGLPPMPPMMPMMMPPPYYPPPPRGRGFAGAIFTTLATTILGASLLLNIYLLFFNGVMSESGGREETIVDGDLSQVVAVIPVNGEIDETTSQFIEKTFRKLEKDSNIRAIVLEVNTPGGEVTASDEIYNRVMQFKGLKKIPVIVSMGGMATSGGYYVSCSGDYIFAEPTTLTGNIGVVLQRFNFAELMDKYGVKDTSITPAESKYKYAESPFRPETPEARAYLSAIAEDVYGKFKNVVSTGRKGKLKATIDEVADGRANPADEAIKLGLVDQKGYLHDAYTYAATAAGIPSGKMRVVRYKPVHGFFDAFADSKFGMKSAGGTSINGVNVNVDGKSIKELLTPKLLYLWRGE